MRTSRRAALAILVSTIILASALTTHLVVAQPSADQADSSDLQSLVQAASSSLTYAQGVIDLALSHGLSVSSELALLASGNNSLTAARAALNPGGNITAGLVDVHEAMGNFTAAASSAGTSIQDAGLTPSVDTEADLDAVAALNDSTIQLSAVIDKTCATTAVSAPVVDQFMQDCATAKTWIANATVELNTAAASLAAVNVGSQGASTAGLTGILTQAKTNVASAAAELMTLSTFTYAARGEAYVNGPLALQGAAANASIELQGKLVGWYQLDLSSFQPLAASQSSSAGGVTSSASTVSVAIPVVSMGSVTASVATQQATLAVALSDLSSLSQQVAALPLPGSTISGIQAGAAAAETSLDTYNSALSALSSSAGSYSGTAVAGFSSYAASFDSAGSSQGADAAASGSSLASLTAQVGTVAGDFPLLSALGTWETTLSGLETSVNAGGSSVSTSFQAASGSAQTVSADISSLTTLVKGVTQMEVGSALLQNVSSLYTSESQFLNSTALVSLSSASASLQSDAQLASEFVASSQSLLGNSIGGFAAASQALNTQGASLGTQAQSTSTSMSSASAYLTADLTARTHAISSAESLISQAVAAFDAQQVAEGAQFVAQASAMLAAASSSG